MASLFTHTFVALAAGRVMAGRASGATVASPEPSSRRFYVLLAACSCLPDADVVGFAFGVRYGDLWGHRGLTHSLPFAFVVGLVVVALAFSGLSPAPRRFWGLVACFTAVTASHGVLDALTDGGLGVAFFSPFDTGRYFLPWRPIQVSPIGVAAFVSPRGARVMLTEFLWVWTPTLAFLAAVHLGRRREVDSGGRTARK